MSKITLTSHGAAREVTGTCHELNIGGKRILLDCGMFQGKRAESQEKNKGFSFNPGKDIDAMILTHAHIDHTGRIPLLYKLGARFPIYCTYATQDLAKVMLADAAYIQEKDEEYFQKKLRGIMLPSNVLYTQKDAAECADLFVGKNYGEEFEVLPGVTCRFLEAGHILGAAMLVLNIDQDGKKYRIGFSGDLGRNTLPIIRDPAPMPEVDTLICESTYGGRAHDDISTAMFRLRDIILKTYERGGKLLIPAFSLERTQEIIYDLHVLWDQQQIPAIPIVVDSPLASRVTDIFQRHPECFDEQTYKDFLSRAHNPFSFSLVKMTETPEESKALNSFKGPMIIMAGSGMCEAGRIRHHLRNNLSDARNTVLAVGFMSEYTLGRKLLDPKTTSVHIFNDVIEKKAEIQYINAYSGHADMHDLDSYIKNVTELKKLFFVHGEMTSMDALASRTSSYSRAEITSPERGKEYEICS